MADDDDERYGPDPFVDPNAPFAGTIINEPIPGSEGGVIEAVKRTVTVALRESITRTGLSLPDTDSEVQINLEYPLEEENYPGIWVQFSITKLNRAGLSHEVWIKNDNNDWMPIQEWTFTGRVTLNVVALTNKERDRISDALIMMFSFSRTPDLVLRQASKDTQQYRNFLSSLGESPYISMTVNTDSLGSGGQTAQMGLLPWQQDILVYEDSYSFDLLGQFNIGFRNDGWYELHRIDINPEYMSDNVPYNPAQWRGSTNEMAFGGDLTNLNKHMPRPQAGRYL